MTNVKLAGKLLKIFNEMGSVPKKGHNKHQNYFYMREVDVMEALKTELIKNKVIMLTSAKFVDIQKKEGKDKTEFVTTVETTHTFMDTETGETLPITSVGSGYDSSDKGASKAITASFKYAVLKTFMISDEGADIENDGQTQQAPVSKPTSRLGFNKGTANGAGQNNFTNTTPPETVPTIHVEIGGPVPQTQTAVQNTPNNSSVTAVTVNAPNTLNTKTTVAKAVPKFGTRPTVVQKSEPKF